MTTEAYTPGYGANAVRFMEQRSLKTHGQFFEAYLRDGIRVLDCGCGPGSMAIDIAALLPSARVVGVDMAASQIERAREVASERSLSNVEFRMANGYELPFSSGNFDRVFCHALIEHLADPLRAIAEMGRVLAPGGVIGLCSPDWGGFIVAPSSAEVEAALSAYTTIQSCNGGDVNAGRRLGSYLLQAGFTQIKVNARYECYDPPACIAEYLARQLEGNGLDPPAASLRSWSRSPIALFAQCWVSAVGTSPPVPVIAG